MNIDCVPIVIGITGHRDLIVSDQLKKEINNIFSELKDKYPNTPFKLMSPLAEGADRLVVNRALENNISLIVPLPMPECEYKKDFKTQESREEFDNLCKNAERVFTLPFVDNNTIESIQSYGDARNKQYEQVGIYIANHSQIIIALWDGKFIDKKGGTSLIVKFILEGSNENTNKFSLALPEFKIVYHINTPRKGEDNLPALETSKIFPEGLYGDLKEAEKAFNIILSCQDQFNADIKNYSDKLSSQIEQSKEWLIPEKDRNILSDTNGNILDIYAISDVLALYFQEETNKNFNKLMIVTVLAILTEQLFGLAHIPHLNITFLILIPIFILIAGTLILKVTNSKNKHGKYLDYRALSEGLRVQLFWKLVGLKENVSDFYLHRQRGGLEWVRNIITYLNIYEDERNSNQNPVEVGFYDIVKHRWIDDQSEFLKKVINRYKTKENISKKYVNICSQINILLMIAPIIAFLFIKSEKSIYYVLSQYNNWFSYVSKAILTNIYVFITNPILFSVYICLMILALTAAGTIQFYLHKKAFTQQIERYNRSMFLFAKVQNKINIYIQNSDESMIKEIIKELGKETLRENGDWVAMYRQRPLELPYHQKWD